MSKLHSRIDALERKSGEFVGFAWTVAEPGETTEQARERYEVDHGLLGHRGIVIWKPVDVPVSYRDLPGEGAA